MNERKQVTVRRWKVRLLDKTEAHPSQRIRQGKEWFLGDREDVFYYPLHEARKKARLFKGVIVYSPAFTSIPVGEQQRDVSVREFRHQIKMFQVAKELADSHGTLLEYMAEAHQPEIDKNHHGDKTPCTYCEAIKRAKEIREELHLTL